MFRDSVMIMFSRRLWVSKMSKGQISVRVSL